MATNGTSTHFSTKKSYRQFLSVCFDLKFLIETQERSIQPVQYSIGSMIKSQCWERQKWKMRVSRVYRQGTRKFFVAVTFSISYVRLWYLWGPEKTARFVHTHHIRYAGIVNTRSGWCIAYSRDSCVKFYSKERQGFVRDGDVRP